MNSRTLGVAAVVLAAVAIATVVIVQRRPKAAAPIVTSAEAIDKLVIDYAYQTMEGLSKGAVTKCGLELAGQEADVTARVNVQNQVVTLSKVRFTQSAWNQQTMDCVTGAFEGHQRSPTADGVAARFPEGSEYELDVHLAFATPTLQYNQ